jgi:alpha-mannosidase
MFFTKEKVQTLCDRLNDHRAKTIAMIENIEFVKAEGYKKNNTPPDTGWEPFATGQRVSGYDAHYWFRANFKTPKADDNKYLTLRITTGKEGQWDATNPQGLLYLNGRMTQGFDTNHTEAFLDSDTFYQLYNYFYVGLIGDFVDYNMELRENDKRIEKLYYDLKVPLDVCKLLNENSDEYVKMMKVLNETANIVDMRKIGSDEFFKSIEKATDYLRENLYENLCTVSGKPVVNCIGHTHIDVEWQWTRAQTREKIQRSFSTACALMEKYPEFKFMLSQPELYRYLKEEAPEKYEELKELVKEGRWEPEGAMWLEADCNLISGESFVRQILQGKKFFKEEFGVDSKVLFLPDVFGYSAALPQILKKSGIRHFVTSKISWNDVNMMPVDSFLWQGIDGSEIFTNFITAQDYYGEKPRNGTTYVGMITPSQVKGAWNRYQQKDYSSRALMTFGFGDGGGGPIKEHLEVQRRLSKGLPGMPVTEIGFLLPHLDKVREQFDNACKTSRKTPRWVGELYLEFHRGTYTSQAKNKRGNRKSEFALQKCEALSYTDLLFGGDYDAAGIYKTWRKVLHNQFHDIIPGSSIHEVYEGTDADYKQIAEFTDSLIAEKLQKIADNVKTSGGILVYNPLGFERGGAVKIDGKTVELKENIPAFGWAVVAEPAQKCDVKISGLCGENKYYKLTLDETGAIISLYDKRARREVVKPGCRANEIQIFEDWPRNYDAWELEYTYKEKMYLADDDVKISKIQDGSRAGWRVEKKYFGSIITQNIWMYSDSVRIDFENDIDWHEKQHILKAAFPIDVHATAAAYEIQYGHVTRPTHENTSWDKAKFEVYGHKWADISENGYGVALLNDCKYGYNAEGSTLKLTLLKCPSWPDKFADEGRHIFTYSIIPHLGDFREAGVIREAYSLNQPLLAKKVGVQSGSLADKFSLVCADKDNIIIETVKKCEDDDSMIVRFYDSFDRRESVTVSVPEVFKEAYLCSLMEVQLEKLEISGGKVTIPVSNFEIVTLKFKK